MPTRRPEKTMRKETGAQKTGPFTLADVKQLIEMLEKTDVTNLVWDRSSGERVSIQRGAQPVVTAAAPHVAVHPIATAPAHAPAAAPAGAPAVQAEVKPGVVVTSPFVGTFYRSPSPEASSFVEVGTVVKKGQVLCIVEAMKLMNEIEAETAGKVAEIFVQNATPVEFGEALFRIEPA